MTYQLTAPLLDACVLGIVDKGDAYGYTLTQRAQLVVDISESTLYPVLRRLQKAGMLSTYDVPYQGRNRRYYSITEDGKSALDYYRKEWATYRDSIDSLLGKKSTIAADSGDTAAVNNSTAAVNNSTAAENSENNCELITSSASGANDSKEGSEND